MRDDKLDVPTKDGKAEAFLPRPEGDGALPGVVMLTDIAGIRPAFHRMARRLAEQDFAVLLPNIFHRVSKLPVFDFEAKMGDERTMKRLGELRAGLNATQMSEDGASYVDFLLAQKGVKPGKGESSATALPARWRCGPRPHAPTRLQRRRPFMAAASIPISPKARIACCRRSTQGSISVTPSRTARCRRKPSPSSRPRSRSGVENRRARPIPGRITAGRFREAPSTTKLRPSVTSRS